MDSLTHIVLGACLGEKILGRQLGKKAMLWGAAAQSAPDIDFVASFWMSTADNLLAHRGFTHSLLFAFIITPFFALAADRWHRPHNVLFRTWILFFGLEILLHLFLDGFNNYGVGWLEPFSKERFTMNILYVADPFFSVWVGVAFILMVFLKNDHRHRMMLVRTGIFFSGLYLLYCTFNKINIERAAKQAFEAQNIPHKRYFTQPTAFNNLLWYIVTGNDTGYYVGFRSVFDRQEHIDFTYFPRNDSLLKNVDNHEELQKLIRFSQEFYTAEVWNGKLVFNDLRFGQIAGWDNPRNQFTFHYFLQEPDENELVVQRGRMAGWNRQTMRSMLRRIKSN